MKTVSVSLVLEDAEYAVLVKTVAEQEEPETVEAYVARVGLKGLRGSLATQAAEIRQRTIAAVTKAFDSADAQTRAAALDTLGFQFDVDGTVIPKKG